MALLATLKSDGRGPGLYREMLVERARKTHGFFEKYF